MTGPSAAEIESTMEIIGSYFIDIFYNDLYIKARNDIRDGRGTSTLTDAYRDNIISYMRGVKEHRGPYGQVVRGLHEYYQRLTVFATITFSEFENKILAMFVPLQYFRDFTEKDKDVHMHVTIRRIVNELGEAIIERDCLRRVIDEHQDKNNVIRLQDIGMGIMQNIRDEYFTRFARKINEKPEMVSADIVRRLKETIVAETKKRCDAEKERDSAVNVMRGLAKRLNEMQAAGNNDIAAEQLQAKVGEMQAVIDGLRSKLQTVESNLAGEQAKARRLEKELAAAAAAQQTSAAAKQQSAPQQTVSKTAKAVSEDSSGNSSDSDGSDSDDESSDTDEADVRRKMLAAKVAERKAKTSAAKSGAAATKISSAAAAAPTNIDPPNDDTDTWF